MIIRKAHRSDLPAVVALLADDALGGARDDASLPLDPGYLRAFDDIDADPNNDLIVGERDGMVIACMIFTVLPSISFRGRPRAQVESVRVATSDRGQGYGRTLFEWAIGEARRRNCHLVQLTTNTARGDAKRFYERLGFAASHVGMKLSL